MWGSAAAAGIVLNALSPNRRLLAAHLSGVDGRIRLLLISILSVGVGGDANG